MPNLGVCTCKGRATIQRDLDRLAEWADRELMKFDNGKCTVLPLGWLNPLHWYRLGMAWLGSSSADEDLGVPANARLNTSLAPEQSRQNTSSELSPSFLAQCFAVLKAQAMSCEVLMQLLDSALAWLRCAHLWLFAVSPMGMTDHGKCVAMSCWGW